MEKGLDFIQFKNIVKKHDKFYLESTTKIDEDIFEQMERCHNCSYFVVISNALLPHCEFLLKLLNKQHFCYETLCGNIYKCDAYKKVHKINLIKTEEEMVDFIESTKNFFGSLEAYEQYYGFELETNEYGECLETLKEYYEKGKPIKNFPKEYPSIVAFDYGEKELCWRSVKECLQ